MAYSVNWSTKVITIPKADLTVVSASPEVYSLDVSDLWQTLIDLQDDADGMTYLDIVRNTPPLTVAGVTLARVVEVINGYTITFENGQYAVNIIGGNSNMADVNNKNMVSVNTANSAGTIHVGGDMEDPWLTPLPGAYAPGTAGAILGSVPTEFAAVPTTAEIADAVPTLSEIVDGVPSTAEIATAVAAAVPTLSEIVDGVPSTAEIATAVAAAVPTLSAIVDGTPSTAEIATAVAAEVPTLSEIVDGVPSTAEIAAAILDEAAGVELNVTVREALRVILAALAGKLSGAGTTAVAIRNVGDTKNRVTATVDAQGNRTAVTVDGT